MHNPPQLKIERMKSSFPTGPPHQIILKESPPSPILPMAYLFDSIPHKTLPPPLLQVYMSVYNVSQWRSTVVSDLVRIWESYPHLSQVLISGACCFTMFLHSPKTRSRTHVSGDFGYTVEEIRVRYTRNISVQLPSNWSWMDETGNSLWKLTPFFFKWNFFPAILHPLCIFSNLEASPVPKHAGEDWTWLVRHNIVKHEDNLCEMCNSFHMKHGTNIERSALMSFCRDNPLLKINMQFWSETQKKGCVKCVKSLWLN